MLAPRKSLWSTPQNVQKTLISWIDLQPQDTVCDLGCGDGRVLIEWASKQTHLVSFIGIEICPDRAEEAKRNVKEAYTSGKISPEVQVTIHCANAMEAFDLYRHVTVFFLYLIPRGLRLIRPMLYQVARERNGDEPLKVITYMSPIPQETPIAKELCRVDHQPGAAWPLYLYHLSADKPTNNETETA